MKKMLNQQLLPTAVYSPMLLGGNLKGKTPMQIICNIIPPLILQLRSCFSQTMIAQSSAAWIKSNAIVVCWQV